MKTNCELIQENSDQTMTQSIGQLLNNNMHSTISLKKTNSHSLLTLGDEV